MGLKVNHSGTNLIPDNKQIRLDDIKLFVEVAQQGSTRKAAKSLLKTRAFIENRIQLLEAQVGKKLFNKSNLGTTLTLEGELLLEKTNEFTRQSANILGFIDSEFRKTKKVTSLVVTEGIGTFWLMPRIRDFNEAHQEIVLDFKCEMKPANLSSYDADISIQLDRPIDDNLIVSTIGYLHIMLFASSEYVNKFGKPNKLNDLPNFTLIEQSAHQVNTTPYLEKIGGNPKNLVSMRMNTSSSHAYAIVSGAGIGPLPTYARTISKNLIPVCDDYHLRREVYLVCHKEATKVAHNKAVIKWIRDAFDSKKYPWFKEDFIHPSSFDENASFDNVIEIFDNS